MEGSIHEGEEVRRQSHDVEADVNSVVENRNGNCPNCMQEDLLVCIVIDVVFMYMQQQPVLYVRSYYSFIIYMLCCCCLCCLLPRWRMRRLMLYQQGT
jgi:hypothetical protein